MRWITRLLLVVVLLYLLVVLAMVLGQRRLMYFPGRDPGPAEASGLAGWQTLRLATDDGEQIAAWFRPPAAGRPLFLFFHGNGGTMAVRASLFRQLTADGSGLLAIDYRGYGGSTGSPSEEGLLRDGEAAWREAMRAGVEARRIVVVGESLGTGVAVAVARDRPVRALVLDSAFSSIADVAQAKFPWLPVRWLLRDGFDSARRIGGVGAPKLFLHNADDPVTPLRFARRLFELAPPPKSFRTMSNRGHVVMFGSEAAGLVGAWLASLPAPD